MQLRIRTLMVAVAILALIIGLGIMWRNRLEYLHERDFFARREEAWKLIAEQDMALVNATRTIRDADEVLAQADRLLGKGVAEQASTRDEEERDLKHAKLAQDRAQYYRAMKRKYEYAASHPWIIVPPDPPEPPAPD